MKIKEANKRIQHVIVYGSLVLLFVAITYVFEIGDGFTAERGRNMLIGLAVGSLAAAGYISGPLKK